MLRTIRSWFTTPTTSKDRFVTNDKPTQTNFQKLFDSVTFVAEKADTAKLTEQGLAKKTLDGLAIAKPSPSAYNDGMTRFIESHQIPDVIAEDASIVVTPVIWDATDGAIVGAVVTGHDCRRRYLIQSIPYANNGAWKELGGGGNFDDWMGVAGPAVPSLAAGITCPSAPLEARKLATGMISLIGEVNVTDPSNFFALLDGTTPMPVGYRPTRSMVFPLTGWVGGVDKVVGELAITTGGVIAIAFFEQTSLTGNAVFPINVNYATD